MIQRADFYILSGTDLKRRDVYACRLIEKVFLSGLSVTVIAEEDAARRFDDLLWTFRDGSFVPHQLCLGADAADPETPIRLRTEITADDAAVDVVVSLSRRLPERLDALARIAVVIDEDVERRRIGREHFKVLRERNFELQTHRVESFD